jgi:hypothetical protein
LQGLYINTGRHKHRINTHTPNIHALSGIRTHDHGVRASEDSSYHRPLGYRDRLASERAKTVHVLDHSATVIGHSLSYLKENITIMWRIPFLQTKLCQRNSSGFEFLKADNMRNLRPPSSGHPEEEGSWTLRNFGNYPTTRRHV